MLARRGPLVHELNSNVPVSALDSFAGTASAETAGWSTVEERSLGSHFPAAKLVELFKRAYRLRRLAHQKGCSTVVSFTTRPNIIALFSKTFFDRRLKVILNARDITSRILQYSKLRRYERFWLRWLIRHFYPQADLIIAVAQGVKRDLVEAFRIKAEKIVVIRNPIDVQMICRRAIEPVTHPWFNGQTGPVIIAVGRLVKLKGFDLLIEAVSQLPKDLHARLVVVGDGEERPKLKRLIDHLGLSEQVLLAGYQENPWRYIARADVFVLSSLTEGLSNVIGEALALGRPVLATDCSPGVRELLQDGLYGLLVPPGDVPALAQELRNLLIDKQLRQLFSQRAVDRAKDFELQATVKAYEAVLEAVIRS